MSFSQTGWNTSVISGGTINPTAPKNTAKNLKTAKVKLNDSTLGSRLYGNPLVGKRTVGAATSVYNNVNVPAYLAKAVNDLNDEQARARDNLNSWQSRLLDLYSQGGENAYLIAEALRATSVNPGSHVGFGAPVQDPRVGEGYLKNSEATANNLDAKTSAMNRASSLERRLAALNKQRAGLGDSGFGLYEGSAQQKLDNSIFNTRSALRQASPMGASAAKSSNGWVSLPTY
jgi:hypothetical protein